MKPLLTFLGAVLVCAPAWAECVTMPDYRTGLDRLVCFNNYAPQPQANWQALMPQPQTPTPLLSPVPVPFSQTNLGGMLHALFGNNETARRCPSWGC